MKDSMRFNQALIQAAKKRTVSPEQLTEIFKSSSTINEIVKTAVNDKIASLEKTEANEGVFDDPNWSHKEAYILGKKSAYRSVLELFNTIEEGGA